MEKISERDDFGTMPPNPKQQLKMEDDFGGMPTQDKPAEQKPAAKIIPRKSLSGRTEFQKIADAIDYVNEVISGDLDFPNPIRDEINLMENIQDGILLSKLLNYTLPNTIDMKSLIRGHSLTTYQKTENLRIALNGALKIGCTSETFTPHMITQGKSVLVIALINQLIKMKDIQKLIITPEIAILTKRGESVEEFSALPTDKIIMRWINYHLQRARSPREVKNLGKDLQDGAVYIELLHELAPEKCSLEGLNITNHIKRMEIVLNATLNIGITHVFNIAKLVDGSDWVHQVLCCNIFNTIHGLPMIVTPLLNSNEFLRSLA